MDFENTRFSVDWFTPGDKRLSFPKSACFSFDDLVQVSADTPLSLCFTPVDDHTHADPRPCVWPSSAPASPLSPTGTALVTPARDSHDAERDLSGDDWRALASPGLVDIADDCASCGVDLDLTCLHALDEQLILSPVDCFTELCWAAAVQDDVHARFVRKKKHRGRHAAPASRVPRARARSCKPDAGRRAAAWKEVETPLPSPASLPPRGYPGSFELERSGPLASKIARQRDDTSPPSSPHAYETSRTYEKEPRTYDLYADPEGHTDTHARDVPTRRAKKRDWTLIPAPIRLPPTPVLKTSPPSPTFRVAVSDLVPFRKRSPLVVSTTP